MRVCEHTSTLVLRGQRKTSGALLYFLRPGIHRCFRSNWLPSDPLVFILSNMAAGAINPSELSQQHKTQDLVTWSLLLWPSQELCGAHHRTRDTGQLMLSSHRKRSSPWTLRSLETLWQAYSSLGAGSCSQSVGTAPRGRRLFFLAKNMLHLSKPKKQACKQQLDLKKKLISHLLISLEGVVGGGCAHMPPCACGSQRTPVRSWRAFHYLSPRNGTHSVLVLVAGTFTF